MKFEELLEDQCILGPVETVSIDGIGDVVAKIDSGNEGHNVLHAVNICPVDDKLRFLTVDNQTLTLKPVSKINILAGGHNSSRPVVLLNIKINSKFYENIPFSLADRSDNAEKVLVGIPFLQKISAVIDMQKPQILESIPARAQREVDEIDKLLVRLRRDFDTSPNPSNYHTTQKIKKLVVRKQRLLGIASKEVVGEWIKDLRRRVEATPSWSKPTSSYP